MRPIAAAVLLAGLLGCTEAAPEPAPAPPVGSPIGREAVEGPHRLTVTGAEWREQGEPGSEPLLAYQLQLSSDAAGMLRSRRPAAATVPLPSVTTGLVLPRDPAQEMTLTLSEPLAAVLQGLLPEVAIELTLLRVEEWKDRERKGLMDAGLDEEVWPPFRMSFMGEGESCWVTASMAGAPAEMAPEAAALAEHLSFEFVAENATVEDSRRRDLVRYGINRTGDAATASFSVCAPGSALSDDPAISYPATVRLRVPDKWEAETVRFVFKDLPVPPRPGSR